MMDAIIAVLSKCISYCSCSNGFNDVHFPFTLKIFDEGKTTKLCNRDYFRFGCCLLCRSLYAGNQRCFGHRYFSGFALLGGAMIRDLAIASTAFEVDVKEVKKAGKIGLIALMLGCVVPFAIGVLVAWSMGYRDQFR